jgi:hypothetical protein
MSVQETRDALVGMAGDAVRAGWFG